MKNYILRTILFVLSFAVGLGFVWLLNFPPTNPCSQELVVEPRNSNDVPSDSENQTPALYIKFKGFVDEEFDLSAKFEITNSGSETFIYGSPRIDLAEPLFICRELKIDGKKISLRKFCDGLTDYELKPGESKVFRVSLDYYGWRKEKTYQIGFNFRKLGENDFNVFWGENLHVTKAIAKRLLKEQKKYGVE